MNISSRRHIFEAVPNEAPVFEQGRCRWKLSTSQPQICGSPLPTCAGDWLSTEPWISRKHDPTATDTFF